MTQPTTAPITIGRYTVEPHVDPERYHDWYVTRTDSMTPGYSGFIEGRASDEASARRLAAGLACLDAVRELVPHLLDIDAEHDHEGALHENVNALVYALRFARGGAR